MGLGCGWGEPPDGRSVQGVWDPSIGGQQRDESRLCSPGFGMGTVWCQLWPVLWAAQAGGKTGRSAMRGSDAAWKNHLPALRHLEHQGLALTHIRQDEPGIH